MLNFKVSDELCIKCGRCAADCPPKCIILEENALPTIDEEDKCRHCQHCLAICPTGAISIMDCSPEDSLELEYNLPTAHSMETLIKGRRSVRNFKKKPLDEKTVRQLLETAWHAPTGTNAQGVHLTALMNREAIDTLKDEIYPALAKLVESFNPEDDSLIHNYMRMVHSAYAENGVDILFRNAPHMLIAHAPKSVPVPKEDCIIALTTFEMYAQSMGVGTVWNGIIHWLVTEFLPEFATRLGVPEDHEIGYFMLFGRPKLAYARTVQRAPATINLINTL